MPLCRYPYTSASGVDPTTDKCNKNAPHVAMLTGFGVLQVLSV